ncbi:hypothetical protein ACH4PU_35835, partial [Streptomyces sp. NPDC021100]|uniref:hypothetical protein n=1 Tax=Streptomyces sp. NPDC021100 TaxID=3365114 RepID=UPI0037B844FA
VAAIVRKVNAIAARFTELEKGLPGLCRTLGLDGQHLNAALRYAQGMRNIVVANRDFSLTSGRYTTDITRLDASWDRTAAAHQPRT